MAPSGSSEAAKRRRMPRFEGPAPSASHRMAIASRPRARESSLTYVRWRAQLARSGFDRADVNAPASTRKLAQIFDAQVKPLCCGEFAIRMRLDRATASPSHAAGGIVRARHALARRT